VNSDAIAKMVEWMEGHTKIGISSCNLLNEDGSIQGTGGHFPTLFKVFCWMFFIDDIPFIDSIIKPFHPSHQKSFYRGTGYYSAPKDLDWVTGAFMLIRREVVESIGLLDEEYFMYMEDVDYCFRAKAKGFGCYFLSKYEIVHLGGKSSKKEYPIISEISVLKLFYKKHYSGWKYPILRMFLKGGMGIRAAIFGSNYVQAYKTA
jgi:GT2 family glycosyltransferase